MKIIPEMPIESWFASIGLLTVVVLIIFICSKIPKLIRVIILSLKKPEKQNYQIMRTKVGLRWKPIKVLSKPILVLEKTGDKFYDLGVHVKIMDGNEIRYIPEHEISHEKPYPIPPYVEGDEK